MIQRDSIYVGQVAKIIDFREDLLNNIYVGFFKEYRSLLFSLTDELYASDLLYDSPQYPIINTTDNNTIRKIKQGNRTFLAVVNSCNLGFLLKCLGYDEFLTKSEVMQIRNTIFSSNFLKNNCDIFGLMKKPSPSFFVGKNFKNMPIEEVDIYGYYKANYFRKIHLMLKFHLKQIMGIQEYEFTNDVNWFFETMKLRDEYLSVLNKLKDDTILSIFQKDNVHLDAFKPNKEEGKIKRLKRIKEFSHIN